MRILVVDDEELAVENMQGLLRQVEPDAEVYSFTDAEEAMAYLGENKVDIALLDIELGEYSGISLAQNCKLLCPQVNIIFVTGYSQYTMEAFKLHASGYLMKPVRVADLRMEIDNLRNPIPKPSGKRIQVQAFGFFEIFVDGELLKFPRTKCKECLAYLVDRRGARVTYRELSAVLWEDRPFDRSVQNNTQRVISDLIKTLKKLRIEELVFRSHQDIAINPAVMDCDYYALLSGDLSQLNAFTGEYMSNYSWAEFTLGKLEKNSAEDKSTESNAAQQGKQVNQG